MERVLLDDVVHTNYGQFDIVWSEQGGFDGDSDRFFAGQVNGLVGAADPGGLYVNLARRSGGSHVRIVLLDGEPAAPEPQWEDVVEVSVTIPSGAQVQWMSGAGETHGALEGLDGGTYRVRVSARGRDAAQADEFAEEVLDHYLIELWPAPHRADAAVRVGSENAKYWHGAWGSLRFEPALAPLVHEQRGRAAAGRIFRDLVGEPGARPLSGERGDPRVEYVYRGPRRTLFVHFCDLAFWATRRSVMRGDPNTGRAALRGTSPPWSRSSVAATMARCVALRVGPSRGCWLSRRLQAVQVARRYRTHLPTDSAARR